MSFSVVAPSSPGTYYLAFGSAVDGSCFFDGQDWWEGAPTSPERYFGILIVQ